MIETLNQLDRNIFLFLNGFHNSVFDFIMFWVTKQETWYPVYVLILIWIFRKFGVRGLFPVIFIALAVTVSDQITSGLMKPYFGRLRPCHDPVIGSQVHLIAGCGGQFGFASGHAANSFTLATLLFFLFREILKYLGWLFLWAAVIGYSRIYAGVHYPGDVLTGALIGIITGYLCFRFYRMLPDRYRIHPN